MSQKRAVLVGGSGFIGSNFANHLKNLGWQVDLQSRRELYDESLAERLRGADLVANFAGKTIACLWTASNRNEILSSRIRSTRAIGTAIARIEPPEERPKCWINGSATGIYGDRGDQVIDESATKGDGFLADVTQQWEQAAIESGAEGVRIVLARFGVVFGNRGSLPVLIRLGRFGLGGRVGTGKQYFPWIDIRDVCKGLLFLAEHQSLGRNGAEKVNLVSPAAIRQSELMGVIRKAILHRVGWKAPLAGVALPMPVMLAHLGRKIIVLPDELIVNGANVVPSKLLTWGFQFDHSDADASIRDWIGGS